MDYYTYAFLREDGTPYYIGKGKGNRAFRKRRGSNPPPSDRILILKKDLSEEDAFSHEVYMISVLGRKDLGTGISRNKTDGGEGSAGHASPRKGKKLSEETKRKMSEAAKKRIYDKKAWSEKMKKSHKSQEPWNKGKTGVYSEERLLQLRESGKIYGKIGGRGNKKN